MVLAIIPFLLYLPTMTGFWGAYSFSRLHDLTWGNRPMSAADAAAPNGGAAAQAKVDAMKARIQFKARVICCMMVVGNGLVVAAVLLGLEQQSWGLYGLVAFVFGFAFLQMVFSFFFILHHRIKRFVESTEVCGYVCCRCRSRNSYYRNVVRGLPESQKNQPPVPPVVAA